MAFNVEFYMKSNGRAPVLGFLYSLEPKLRAKAFKEIELLHTMGDALKEPYVKPIKRKNNKGLYELRIKLSSDAARIFYFSFCNNKYILLHGFIKKSMQTPKKEIERARKYMQDYIGRCKL